MPSGCSSEAGCACSAVLELLPAHRHEARAQPFGDRLRHLGHAHGAIDVGRRAHLIGPAHARLPALVDELLRGGRQRIRHRMPDVDAAVAVEIDAVLVEFGRQELRVAGRAGPGRAKILARHVALAEDLQREDELAAILILAAADIGLRRQHAQRVVRQRVAAVVGLAAPDRQHDVAGTPKRFSIAVSAARCFCISFCPSAASRAMLASLHIIRRHLHEFGLRRRAGRGPARQDQIGQFVVGLEPARFGVERRARDAGGLRLRPQRGDELREGGVGGANAGRNAARASPQCHDQNRGRSLALSQSRNSNRSYMPPINARRPASHVRRNHSTAGRHRRCRSPTG